MAIKMYGYFKNLSKHAKIIFIMKKFLLPIFVICIVSFGVISQAEESSKKIDIFFFSSSHCEECFFLEDEILPPLKEKYTGKVYWREINIDQSPANLELARSMVLGEKKTGTLSPSIVIGDTVLMGSREIELNLEQTIDAYLKDTAGRDVPYTKTKIIDVFKGTSLLTVCSGGLVDGLNPCAFAVIAFLVAIMSVYGFSKKNIITIGFFYCFAVFATYLFIGFGLFNFIYTMNFYKISSIFHIAIGILCLLFAALSVYDYFLYKRTHQAGDLLLTLPLPVKKKISSIMGAHLRNKKEGSFLSLSLAAFSVGIMVSLLEMVCTGQVYVPTLVYIIKNTDYKVSAFIYILLYNFMFILPLIAILILFLMGVSSKTFNDFLKKHIGALKLALAMIFLALGVGILLAK